MEGGKEALLSPFYKGTNHIYKGSTLNLVDHLPKVPPPNISTLGTGFQHMHFEGTQTFSIGLTFSYCSLIPHSHLPSSQQVLSAKSQVHE